jgi:iron complex outermembrane recepter protein
MTVQLLRWVTSASMILVLLAFAGIQPAQAQAKEFNVPVQSATTGIPEFARQAGIQILVSEPLVRGKKIAAVTGRHSVAEALTILLKGTGLIATSNDGATYTLAIARAPPTSLNSSAAASVLAASPPRSQPASIAESSPAMAEDEKGVSRLEEIIVTAQKRSERLQDVPVPVTAISADTLLESNQLRLQDYYASIPGLSFAVGPYGEPFVVIRGLTSNAYTTPTVGVTVDDLPYGASTGNASGYTVPDIDPSDLARVEVLRGPQGTLYGASSMGGLLKYVTVDPSTEALSGRLQASGNLVQNGAQTGYSVRGSVNVPLSDIWAVRASAFTRLDPGYVGNVQTGQSGVNRGEANGGRLSALWRPTDSFSLKLGALFQDTKTDGSPDVEPSLGDLKQSALRGTGEYERKSQVYSANLTAKLGSTSLTSVTGYSIDSFSSSLDLTSAYGTTAESFFPGITGASVPLSLKTSKFSQELRLSAPIGHHFDWLLGAFYTHENTPAEQDIDAVDPSNGTIAGALLQIPYTTTYQEIAAFADLTVHFSDRFDVQFGGRESQNKQIYAQENIGPLLGGASGLIPTEYSKANAFTYLLTPRFRVSPDLMIYARFASGYRAGGPNANSQLTGVPSEVNSDKTQNYELGVKGNALDHRFSFDASLYYIDWKDIQLSGVQDGFSFFFNGAGAKSQGLEISVESRPLTGLTLAAWIALNDAKLTQSFPPQSVAAGVYGVAGDRLPYGSRLSGSVSIEQTFAITNGWNGFVAGSVNYVGDRVADFEATAQRQDLPAYAKVDLRMGAKYETWAVNAFANNVANKRGILQGDLPTNPSAFIYIQPRTVGLSVSKQW